MHEYTAAAGTDSTLWGKGARVLQFFRSHFFICYMVLFTLAPVAPTSLHFYLTVFLQPSAGEVDFYKYHITRHYLMGSLGLHRENGSAPFPQNVTLNQLKDTVEDLQQSLKVLEQRYHELFIWSNEVYRWACKISPTSSDR